MAGENYKNDAERSHCEPGKPGTYTAKEERSRPTFDANGHRPSYDPNCASNKAGYTENPNCGSDTKEQVRRNEGDEKDHTRNCL